MSDDSVPSGMAKIQCITENGVWARVNGQEPRPLSIDEVVMVPRGVELDLMKRRRHVVEIA